MNSFGLGSLAGGFATGLREGMGLAQGQQLMEMRRQQSDQQLQRGELELVAARRAEDQAKRDLELQQQTDELMRQYPEKGRLADKMDWYEKHGRLSLQRGKITPDQHVKMQEALRQMEGEGTLDAYRKYKETGDINAAIDMFNAKGDVKLNPETIRPNPKRDPISGNEYMTYSAASFPVDAQGNTKTIVFDPLQAAETIGGVKGYLDFSRARREGHRTDIAERQVGLGERKQTEAERANLVREAQRDDANEIMARRIEAVIARANGSGRPAYVKSTKDMADGSVRVIMSDGSHQLLTDPDTGAVLKGTAAKNVAARLVNTAANMGAQDPVAEAIRMEGRLRGGMGDVPPSGAGPLDLNQFVGKKK